MLITIIVQSFYIREISALRLVISFQQSMKVTQIKGTVHQPNKFRLYAQCCQKNWRGNFCFVHRRLETP